MEAEGYRTSLKNASATSLKDAPREVIQIQRKHNALAPISCLPVEIFYIILMWCKRLKPRSEPEGSWPSHIARRAVLHISHTCHMCRTLTLSFPTVWADIDFHDPASFATCLERSQRLPISIKFDTWLRHRKYAFESSIITWGLQTIHKEFHRIYNLIISCQLDLANQDLFDQNSSQELPLLVDLEINLRQRSESARPPNPAFCFTRWLLAHSAPRLKKLVIRDLSFEWWQCRTFPSGLTHLSISMFYNGFQGHDYCTLAEVLTCLGQLSSLENLDLSGALPINTRPISGSRGVALTPMPQLKLLTLESLLRSAIHFLTYLQLPPLVAVWISGGGIDHDGGEYKDLCSDLIPFMQGRTALQSYKSMVSFGIVNDLGNGGSVSFLGSRSFSSSLDSLVAEYHLTLD